MKKKYVIPTAGTLVSKISYSLLASSPTPSEQDGSHTSWDNPGEAEGDVTGDAKRASYNLWDDDEDK